MNSLETLRTRYAQPQSRYVTLGDVPVHYTDEGVGPVIVMVHGSFFDLASYDAWCPVFAGFRKVRYDRLRWGLTGQGPGATIDYADEESLLARLADHLQLDRFVLAGSSSGGMTAAAYAAHHPERVSRLILANFPLGHGRINNASHDRSSREGATVPSREAMARLLQANFHDPAQITPEMIARYADMLDREDPTGAAKSSYAVAARFTEEARRALLGELEMPTLVMWSRHNRTLPVENGRAAFAAVGARDKLFTVIEGAGHMLPLEQGELSGRAARRFIEGERLPASLAP